MNAPVALFTYKRPEHTQKVLEALMLCEGIEDTDVFIFADGARSNANEKDLSLIARTRQLLVEFKNKNIARSTQLNLADTNKGLAKSVQGGIDGIFTSYENIIVLEDDVVPAKGFLRFMNEALKKYEHQEQIWGVSGYAFPAKDYTAIKENTFFLPINSSWGWATWRDRWQKVVFDTELVWNSLDHTPQSKYAYNFGGYYHYQILENQKQGKIDSWATLWQASMFLQKGMFLFPKYSLVRNIGFDNTATHSMQEDAYFYNTPTVDYITLDTIPITLDSEGCRQVEKAFRQHFAPSFMQRLQNKLNPKSPYFFGKMLKRLR